MKAHVNPSGDEIPELPRSEYARRVAAFFAKMKPQSIAVIVGAAEQYRSNDTTFAFRQSSDMLYMTGFPEPDAAVVLVKGKGGDQKVVMFVRPKDPSRETWNGFREGPAGAIANFGATEAHDVETFASVFGKLYAGCKHLYYKLGRNADFDGKVLPVITRTQKPIFNPELITHELRLFKSAEEVHILRHIAGISALAHQRAMQRCRPGMRERQLQATLEFTFQDAGAEYVAYTSIVAGTDGVILHYTTNHKVLPDGNLVVIDAGGELRGYASDITRTFPVNGKFSEPQRQLYDLVLKANLAGIAAAKKGSSLNKIHLVCQNVLRAGLIDLGILTSAMSTAESEKAAVAAAKAAGTEAELLTLYDVFMHGTSHYMGMDVHDVCPNGPRDTMPKARRLKPGMVFTVEPGLYFKPDDLRVPAQYRGIGIRVEDDVLITETGNDVLTAGITKDADEIEALMASSSD